MNNKNTVVALITGVKDIRLGLVGSTKEHVLVIDLGEGHIITVECGESMLKEFVKAYQQ